MLVASHSGHRLGQPCTALCTLVRSVTIPPGVPISPYSTRSLVERALAAGDAYCSHCGSSHWISACPVLLAGLERADTITARPRRGCPVSFSYSQLWIGWAVVLYMVLPWLVPPTADMFLSVALGCAVIRALLAGGR